MSNVEIECYIQTNTEKAVLISAEKMGSVFDQWIPKSLSRVIETRPNGLSRIAVPEWIVVERGLDALVTTDAEDERS